MGSSSVIYFGSIGGRQKYFNKYSSFCKVFCFLIKKSQKLFHPSLKFSNCLFIILLFNFFTSSPIFNSFALSLVILYEYFSSIIFKNGFIFPKFWRHSISSSLLSKFIKIGYFWLLFCNKFIVSCNFFFDG